LFEKLKYALHLPQYLSYLVSGQMFSDLTSIGCHTALWDFERNDYHNWVIKEHITDKLAPIHSSDETVQSSIPGSKYKVGIGLHDSSAALIPYLVSFKEPFILLSTGTWAISLNPFNQSPLTEEELKNDCLNYIQYTGKPVKASRLFSGHEYDKQVTRIAAHFNVDPVKYRNEAGKFEAPKRKKKKGDSYSDIQDRKTIAFGDRNLSDFSSDIEAYYQLMEDIICQQKISTDYVLKGTPVKRIFVDGGFSKNAVFMHLLAAAFPQLEVYAASMAQATALGTALAIHDQWNTKPLPHDLIELKYYSGKN
jgi:sugar (pentulose or hexulose) kinase